MDVVAHHQVCGRSDQVHIARREIGGEIDAALGQHHVRQEREMARQRFGLREAHQPHAAIVQQPHDLRRIGVGDHHRGVDLPASQRFDRVIRVEIQQGRVAPVQAGERQHLQRKRPRAAALGTDGNAPPTQTRDVIDLRALVEDPQRLVVQARQRHQVRVVALLRDPALHEADAHAGIPVHEALEVVHRTRGAAQLQLDSVAPQPVAVLAGVAFVCAALGAARHHDFFRRGGLHELERDPERRDDDREHGQQQAEEVAAEAGARQLGHGGLRRMREWLTAATVAAVSARRL